MALNLETLSVALRLDGGPFKSGLTQAESRLNGFRDKLSSAGESVTNFGQKMTTFVTLPLVGMGVAFVNWASDVEESTSAVTQVYGEGADFIIDKSEDAANAVFLSQGEYLEAAATLGVYGDAAGLTGDDLSAFGDSNISAAADLASFYNAAGGVPAVLEAIQSGLVGEYEPLRQYGIVLNEAAVNEYAWANGIAVRGEALTEQQKILARHGLIMESLGAAQGDAQRTADGLANSTRRLQARFKDIGATIGRILLPVAMRLVDGLDGLFDWIEDLSPAMLKWVVIIAAAAAAIGPLTIGLGFLISGFGTLVGVIAFFLSPLGLLVAGIALLAYHFRKDLLGVIGPVIDKFRELQEVFEHYLAISGDPMLAALGALQKVFPQLTTVVDHLRDALNAFRAGDYAGMFWAIWDAVEALADGFLDWAISVAAPAILDFTWDIAALILDKLGDITVSLTNWVAKLDGAKIAKGALNLGKEIGTWVKNNPVEALIAASAITLLFIGAPAIVFAGLAALGVMIALMVRGELPPEITINAAILTIKLAYFALEIVDLATQIAIAIVKEIGLFEAIDILEAIPINLTKATVQVGFDITTEIALAILKAIPGGVVYVEGLKFVLGSAEGGEDGSSSLNGMVTGLLALSGAMRVLIAAQDALKASTQGAREQTLLMLPVIEQLGPVAFKAAAGAYVAQQAALALADGFSTMNRNASGSIMSFMATSNLGFTNIASTAKSQTASARSATESGFSAMKSSVDMHSAGMQTAMALKMALLVANVSLQMSLMKSAVQSNMSAVPGIVSSGMASAANAASSMAGRFFGAGADAIQGLVNGASSRLGALQNVVDQAIAIMARIPALGRSPWPMMIGAGHDAMDGLTGGIDDRMPALNRQIGEVIGAFASASPAMSGDIRGFISGGSAGGGNVYHFYSLKSDELVRLIQKAEAGGNFAEQFGAEVAMRGGTV